MFDKWLRDLMPYVNKWVTAVTGIGGAFGGLFSRMFEGNTVFDSLIGYLMWCIDLGLQMYEAIYNIVSAVWSIGESLGLWSVMGEVVGWLWGIVQGFYETLISGLVYFSQLLLVVSGMVADQSYSIGEKITNLVKLILSEIIRLVQTGIPIWADFAKRMIDILTSGAETMINSLIRIINEGTSNIYYGLMDFVSGGLGGIANKLWQMGLNLGTSLINGFISTVNNGIGMITSSLNGWLNALPDWARRFLGGGVGSMSMGLMSNIASGMDEIWKAGQIKEVDLSGFAQAGKNVIDGMASSLSSWLADIKGQYGLDITLDDLAKKYNVDLSEFDNLVKKYGHNTTELKDPNTKALKENTAAVKENSQKQAKVEIYMTNTFRGEYDEATIQKATKTTTDAIVNGLRKGGIVV
jgi:hypothetical protein